MPTGSSRRTSTRTTSPLLCSPRSKGVFYSPRYSRVPVRSRLPSILFWPLPSADEPEPGSISAVRAVVSRLLDVGWPRQDDRNPVTAPLAGETFHFNLDGTVIV